MTTKGDALYVPDRYNNFPALEEYMKGHPQVEIPIDEEITESGLYMRRMTVPPETWVMGERHRTECVNILLSGLMTLYPEDGSQPFMIEGPKIFHSKKYSKKFAYCHTTVVFITIHTTTEKDPHKAAQQLIIPEYEYRRLIASGVVEDPSWPLSLPQS